MPLSEQEQRLLDEMERSLYQNDADFVASVRSRGGRPNYTMVVVGVLIAIAGIALLVAGVIIRQPLVGVLGFIVMFAGVLLAVAPPRGARAAERASAPSVRGRKGGSRLMDDLNARWDRRQEGRD